MVKGWSLVFQGPEYAAQTVAAILKAAGFRIETMTDTGGLWPGGPGGPVDQTRVFVPDEEAVQARRFLESKFPDADQPSS